MLSTNPERDLMHFIETNILPKYSEFGKSHGISHVQRVIKNSLKLAQITGADDVMAIVTNADVYLNIQNMQRN